MEVDSVSISTILKERAISYTFSGIFLSEVVNIIHDLAHRDTFSDCGVGGMFEGIVAEWAHRYACPGCVVGVKIHTYR